MEETEMHSVANTTKSTAKIKDFGFVALYTQGNTIRPKLSIDKHVTSGGDQLVKFKAWALQHEYAPKLVRKLTLTNQT